MPGWLEIAFWGLAFAGTHMGLSSPGLRGRLVARLGARRFQGVYSLVSFATFVPFVGCWWGDRHGGPLLWHLREVPGVRELAIALGVLAFVLIALGAAQPSAAGLLPGGRARAYGITRITRHAVFMGVGLWAVGHLSMNGWASDVAFFGAFGAVALLGSAHQDARKRGADPSLAELYAETSYWPFAAILAGRQKLVLSELSLPALAVGLVLGIGLFWFHDPLFR